MQAIRQTSIHAALNQATPMNVLTNDLTTNVGKAALLIIGILSISMSILAPSLLAGNVVLGGACLTATFLFLSIFAFHFGNAATRNHIEQALT